ncbi:hypothetical protein OFN23_33505, partial [Escherichia coli]|nr:hypothetical protein [Escherichia coli]
NGNPSDPGENDPTPVSLEPVTVGLAKAVTKVTQVGSGIYDVQYTLIAKNLGSTDAPAAQVSDDLRFTFPAPASFALVSAPAV